MQKVILYIPKMDCAEEVNLIKNRLNSISEIKHLSFDLIQKELTITYESVSISSIQNILKNLGMNSFLKNSEKQKTLNIPAVSVKDWLIIVLAGFLAVCAEIIAYATKEEQSALVIILAISSMLIGGRATFIKGLRSIRYFNLNMNFLMSIAIIGAISIGEWPEAAMVAFLFSLAELIEIYSLDRARHAISGLMEIAPDVGMVKDKDDWVEKPVNEIKIGEIIGVRPGKRIPLDGVICKGETSINQAPITGESFPVIKKIGDSVFAGTINELGSIEIRVTVQAEDTLLSKIVRAVQQAQSERANTQRFVDVFAKYYTPSMVVIAIIIAAIPPWLLNADFLYWFYKALVLLVIACPCALVISTPVTIVSGLAAAAKHGLLIKGGLYLELGHKLKAIAFDKTGTLTIGKPVVTDFVIIDSSSSDKRIMQLIASLDIHSEHPVANAVINFWKEKYKESSLCSVESFEAIPGRGVTGIIDNNRYFLGNHRLAEDKGICNAQIEAHLEHLEKDAKTTIVLGTEHSVLAIVAVADVLREDSKNAIQMLHKIRLTTVMITGDNPVTAQAIARQLGIDDVKANLLPEDKLKTMDELLKKHSVVGMVGDGINDAPALAKATIGFAMGHGGTDIALETADIALMENNLNKIPFFVKLSKRTWTSLVENISLSIGIKIIFFILALFGLTTLWMAVFADMGASIIVVLNGLRLLRYQG